MQLFYRGIRFPAGATVVKVGKETLLTPLDEAYGERWTVDVQGTLFGADQADLTNQCAILERELRIPGGDLILLRDDGGVAMALTNPSSTSGVRILRGPNYPVGDGADYSTFRVFSFTAVAEYPYAPGALILIQFDELIETSGGGSEFGFIRCANAKPVKTMLYAATPYLVTQSGSAVGLGAYPVVPPPLFPNDLLRAPRVRRGSPQLSGRVVKNYPVQWQYDFGSADPLG